MSKGYVPQRGKEQAMIIHLGNLSVEQIEKRTGITLSDEHREYMKAHRQEAVNDTPIADGAWHCFDIPFRIMTGNKETAEHYRDMLSTYDWSECKEPLQIGWERSEVEK